MNTLARSQVSAFAASAVDLAVTMLLVEVVGALPGVATVGGNVAGAASNFLLNRRWTFRSTTQRLHRQALKYGVVWCGYVALNYTAMIAGTQALDLPYLPVKLVSAVALGSGYNYVLHKRFVYA